ncbi:MAG: alpha/beta hydrolase [Hyphomonadaceae bacterium]|nr:alpha/beta hydrolase [Hyphomonadaceae bacterium]
MKRRAAILLGLTGAAAIAAFVGWTAFSTDLGRARVRVGSGSAVIASRFGPLEYAQAGEGHAVLVIHGTGGGFDQGMEFGQRLVNDGWRVIAPSRFGYLRSAYPDDPSSANQADAYVDLLDELGIEKAAIIGVSAGALSAIEFAVRHPDRCAALVAVVPAAYAPGRPPVTPPNAFSAAIIEYALKSDALFWVGNTFAEDAMIAALLATDPALVRSAAPSERSRARKVLKDILPVSERTHGLLNDARLAGAPSPAAVETIRAPTLAISLEDDRFQTLAAARHLAGTVPGARLLSFPSGGHVWVGHNDDVFAAIDQTLADAFALETLSVP